MRCPLHASVTPSQVWIRQHEVKEETVLFQELPHALRNEVAWNACKPIFRRAEEANTTEDTQSAALSACGAGRWRRLRPPPRRVALWHDATAHNTPCLLPSSAPLLCLSPNRQARPPAARDGRQDALPPSLQDDALPASEASGGHSVTEQGGTLLTVRFNPSLCCPPPLLPHSCRFSPGHDLVTEGDPADRFWILNEGE